METKVLQIEIAIVYSTWKNVRNSENICCSPDICADRIYQAIKAIIHNKISKDRACSLVIAEKSKQLQ